MKNYDDMLSRFHIQRVTDRRTDRIATMSCMSISRVSVLTRDKKSFLKGLMTINNKILRILQHQPLHTHTEELYKMYNTLTIPDLHDYQLCNLVHKFLYNKETASSV